MKTNFKNSQKYDQSNSTFKQIIYLTNGKFFVGYSKKLGYNEKVDKVALLKNWILRMYKSGYLNKINIGTQKEIDEIHYFINDHIEAPLLTLNYSSYEVSNIEWCTSNFKIIQFLDTFYNYIRTDKEFKISRLFDYSKGEKLDKLKTDTKRFLTHKALYNWIKSEIEKKDFTTFELSNFYNSYKIKYFNDGK
jgi:hypothetical protein